MFPPLAVAGHLRVEVHASPSLHARHGPPATAAVARAPPQPQLPPRRTKRRGESKGLARWQRRKGRRSHRTVGDRGGADGPARRSLRLQRRSVAITEQPRRSVGREDAKYQEDVVISPQPLTAPGRWKRRRRVAEAEQEASGRPRSARPRGRQPRRWPVASNQRRRDSWAKIRNVVRVTKAFCCRQSGP